MIRCIKTYIIAYVKTQKIRFIIHYVKSTAQLFFFFKFDFQKVGMLGTITQLLTVLQEDPWSHSNKWRYFWCWACRYELHAWAMHWPCKTQVPWANYWRIHWQIRWYSGHPVEHITPSLFTVFSVVWNDADSAHRSASWGRIYARQLGTSWTLWINSHTAFCNRSWCQSMPVVKQMRLGQ